MSDKFIPLSVPNFKGNELRYVSHAVETEWVSTADPYVNDFKKGIAEYVHAPSAVSCQNGTSGLHISLLLCGVTKDDEVIVPTLTFIAAVSPVKYIGAEPILMDCDDSLCIDPIKLKSFCEHECDFMDGKLIKKTRKQIKAVIVVHVFGNMANRVSIIRIARTYHLKVIEDTTEALGADCIKFQTFISENLVSENAKKADYQVENTIVRLIGNGKGFRADEAANKAKTHDSMWIITI